MKPKSSQNQKLSEDTINLFVQYHELQKEKNIALHKIILYFFLITDIILIIFTFSMKIQINSVNQTNNDLNNTISSTKISRENQRKEMYHYFVNLYGKINVQKFYLTEIFQSKEEFSKLINSINYFSPEDNIYSVILCYKSDVDGDVPTLFYEKCKYENLLVVVETMNGKRFGGFTTKGYSYNKTYDQVEDKYSFLFSLDENKIFHINKTSKAFRLIKDGFFVFGDDDLVIKPNFRNGQMAYTSFPKSFGDPNKDTLDQLTGGEWEFEIKSIEIFGLYAMFYLSDN